MVPYSILLQLNSEDQIWLLKSSQISGKAKIRTYEDIDKADASLCPEQRNA